MVLIDANSLLKMRESADRAESAGERPIKPHILYLCLVDRRKHGGTSAQNSDAFESPLTGPAVIVNLIRQLKKVDAQTYLSRSPAPPQTLIN